MWAISNGDTTFTSWGINSALIVCQDMFFNEPLMLFFIHVVSTELMRPQLKHIYNVLNSVAMEIISDHDVLSEDIQFVQYLSGACRAARSPKALVLPSADLLRHLSDFDLHLCRENRHASLGLVAAFLIAIPAILSFAPDKVQEGAFSILLSSVSASFVLLNDYMVSKNGEFLIALYVAIPIMIIFYYKVYKPRHKKRIRSAPVDGSVYMNTRGWRYFPVSINSSRTLRYISRVRLLTSHNTRKYFNYNSPIKTEWRNMNLPTLVHGEVVRISSQKVASQDPIVWNRNLISLNSSFSQAFEENKQTSSSSLLNFILPTAYNNSIYPRMCDHLGRCCFNVSLAQTLPRSHRPVIKLLDQAISTNALNHQRGVVTDWRNFVTQKQRDNMGMEYYDEAEALFCRLDVDQKGYLTYMNLEPLARWLMKVSGINMNDMELPTFAELDEIIDMLEVVFCVHPHDGKITFDQFLLWYESIERNGMHALISRKLNFICTEIHPF